MSHKKRLIVVPRWSGLFGDGQLSARNFTMRYSDNAFLPQVVKDAIAANTLQNYSAPTATTPGVAGATEAARFARHSFFGPQRFQQQARDLYQFTAALNGDFDSLFFVKNINWEIAYTAGEVENESEENSVDGQRLATLMIENNVGVNPREKFELKEIDSDYFEET